MTPKQEQLKKILEDAYFQVSFRDRGGKLYLHVSYKAVEADMEVEDFTPLWRKVKDTVDAIYPGSYMTSGGMGEYTFRLNTGIKTKSKPAKTVEEMAREIVHDPNSEKNFVDQQCATIAKQVESMIESGADREVVKEVEKTMLDWVKTDLKWSDIEQEIIGVYLKHFTRTELEQIVKFKKTPFGKMYTHKMGVAIADLVPVVENYIKGKQHLLMERVGHLL